MEKKFAKISSINARISRISRSQVAGSYEYRFTVFSPSFRRFASISFLSSSDRIFDAFDMVNSYRGGVFDVSLDSLYDAFNLFACQFDCTAKHLTSKTTFTSEQYHAIDNKYVSHVTFEI